MKHIAYLFAPIAFALLLITSAQAETVSPRDASYYVGTTLTVEGVVSQVTQTNSGTTFINFGGRYPNHVFYAVIFQNIAGEFSALEFLEGKTVSINGTVEMYKGKPQIVIISPDQIEVRQ